MDKRTLNAVIVQRIELAPGLIIIRVAPEGWALPGILAAVPVEVRW